MGTFIDLTGRVFEKWTVLSYSGQSMWRCQCDCGIIKDIKGVTLTKGLSTGCLSCRRRYVYLAGLVFGELYVVERAYGDFPIGIHWFARCSCGNLAVVSTGNLLRGETNRCQKCMRKNRLAGGALPRQHVRIETGIRNLTIDDGVHESTKIPGVLSVYCKYCGESFEPSYEQVRTRIKNLNGRPGEGSFYCSDGCKNSCPTFRKIKHQGGFAQKTPREVPAALRKEVFRRDNWTCQVCGKSQRDGAIHCHHILPAKLSPMTSADPDACITLCVSCHKEIHSKEGCRYFELRRQVCAK